MLSCFVLRDDRIFAAESHAHDIRGGRAAYDSVLLEKGQAGTESMIKLESSTTMNWPQLHSRRIKDSQAMRVISSDQGTTTRPSRDCIR